MAKSIDAIALLETQHREVEALFEAYEDAHGDEKQHIFESIADALSAHATIEEELFYPAVFTGPTEDQLREAVEEHLGIKRIIADLLQMDSSDEQFDSKVLVLKEQVEHHVKEEEGELFPDVRKLVDPATLVALAETMRERFDALMQEEPRNAVTSQTDEAAHL